LLLLSLDELTKFLRDALSTFLVDGEIRVSVLQLLDGVFIDTDLLGTVADEVFQVSNGLGKTGQDTGKASFLHVNHFSFFLLL